MGGPACFTSGLPVTSMSCPTCLCRRTLSSERLLKQGTAKHTQACQRDHAVSACQECQPESHSHKRTCAVQLVFAGGDGFLALQGGVQPELIVEHKQGRQAWQACTVQHSPGWQEGHAFWGQHLLCCHAARLQQQALEPVVHQGPAGMQGRCLGCCLTSAARLSARDYEPPCRQSGIACCFLAA